MVKVFYSSDGSWGYAEHMLVGEFTSTEWVELYPGFVELVGSSDPHVGYEYFKNIPQVVDLDSIEAPEDSKTLPLGIVGMICETCFEDDHLICSKNPYCHCCIKTKKTAAKKVEEIKNQFWEEAVEDLKDENKWQTICSTCADPHHDVCSGNQNCTCCTVNYVE